MGETLMPLLWVLSWGKNTPKTAICPPPAALSLASLAGPPPHLHTPLPHRVPKGSGPGGFLSILHPAIGKEQQSQGHAGEKNVLYDAG